MDRETVSGDQSSGRVHKAGNHMDCASKVSIRASHSLVSSHRDRDRVTCHHSSTGGDGVGQGVIGIDEELGGGLGEVADGGDQKEEFHVSKVIQ